MSSKSSLTGRGFAFAMTAGIVAVSAIFAAKPSLAQTAPAGGTASIQHDSEKAREMKEPSILTREERLNAKPLDWNSTLGTPTPRTATAKERRALKSAKPKSSAGGAPNRDAEKEARKLHPDDWK
jgi:flavin-dependent dehydrogenase